MSKELIDYSAGVCIIGAMISGFVSVFALGVTCWYRYPAQQVLGATALTAGSVFVVFCLFSTLVWFKAKY